MTSENVFLYHHRDDLLSKIIDFIDYPIKLVQVNSSNIIQDGEFRGKDLARVFPTAEPPLLDDGLEYKTTEIAILMYLLENTHTPRLLDYHLGTEARFCCYDNLHRISGLGINDFEEEDLEFTDKVSIEQLIIYFLVKDEDVSYLPNLCKFKSKFARTFKRRPTGQSRLDFKELNDIYDRHFYSTGIKYEYVLDLHQKLFDELVSQGFGTRQISLGPHSILIVELENESYLLDVWLNGPLKPVQVMDGIEFAAGGGRFLKMQVDNLTVSVKLLDKVKHPQDTVYLDLYRFDLDMEMGKLEDRDQNVVFVKRERNGSMLVVGRFMENNGREKFEVKMVDYNGNCMQSKVIATSESEVEWQSFLENLKDSALC